MINDFQKSLLNNRDVAWEIVKIYHSDIAESLKDKLSITKKYDWICLEISKKVSLGISFNCRLMSGNKALHLFEEELKNSKFSAWRFYDDSKYIAGVTTLEKDRVEAVNKILEKNNIPKPTAKQMSDYYHSD